jgi:ABC-type multidrug transport system fused ATPase/permease subunit
VLNIICNILMVLFSVISIPVLIPFLQLLLEPNAQVKVYPRPETVKSIADLSNLFYFHLNHVIETNGKERALIIVCVCIVTTFFFSNLFRYLSLYFINPMRNGIVRDIRKQLFHKTLQLPLSYFSNERKGDLMSRITSDVQEIEWSILNVLESIVREPLTIIGSLSFMLYISPQLTGFVFILLILTAGIIGGIGKSLKKQSGEIQTKFGELVSILEETLGGLRVIKGFHGEAYQEQKFNKENDAYRWLLIKTLRRRDLASPLSEFMGIGVVTILIWYGFKQVQSGALSPSALIAFVYAFFRVIDPAKSLSASVYNIQKGLASVERVNKILQAENNIVDAPCPQKLTGLHEAIEYKNISFKYQHGDKEILKHINLRIPKGKTVALVGASGAGKSTMADLLPRFYDPTQGEITIDGVDIRSFTLKDLRGLMGIVTQEAILFNDTIYNNIVFGQANVTQQQVEEAAKSAFAHDFILATQHGYQTNIGDRGTKLSGGQKQRITIARALLKNPEILILDEATSALDAESEQLVQAALAKLMLNRTAIIIAHRLSTVQHADQIIVLHQGAIVEQGTHTDLLALEGVYAKMV